MFKKYWSYALMLVTLIVLAIVTWLVLPPFNRPTQAVTAVSQGESVRDVAEELEQQHIVTSSFFLRGTLKLYGKVLGKNTGVVAGEYLFDAPQSVFVIADRLSRGDYSIPQSQFIVPEGTSVVGIAAILQQKDPSFNAAAFVALAKSKEGYLFPDTYTLVDGATPSEIIDVMNNEFNTKIASLTPTIAVSSHNLNEIITMASILEGEANTSADRKIVAGILWKRIQLGIRLQVDSTLRYESGKTSAELTSKDLETSTPYNTYRNYGLPPGPISNPGLEAIEDALNPTETNYLYFLTDTKGGMHYAETFEDHVVNKNKYL